MFLYFSLGLLSSSLLNEFLSENIAKIKIVIATGEDILIFRKKYIWLNFPLINVLPFCILF